MGKHLGSVDSRVLHSIQGHDPGWVFTPAHLSELGSRTAIATALKRYHRAGLIRAIARGLYERPRTHPKLGVLAPDVEAVAEALKTRDAIRLQASGAYAANLLGLSDQVPMRIVYLTDGRTRRLKIGNLQILLRRTTPRNMATAGTISGLVIQALRWLSRHRDYKPIVRQLRKRLSANDKHRLAADAHYAPEWVAQIMRKIAHDEEPEN